jgi:hypothetical protein
MSEETEVPEDDPEDEELAESDEPSLIQRWKRLFKPRRVPEPRESSIPPDLAWE